MTKDLDDDLIEDNVVHRGRASGTDSKLQTLDADGATPPSPISARKKTKKLAASDDALGIEMEANSPGRSPVSTIERGGTQIEL